MAIEVKTIVGTGNLLKISRLGQLETDGLSSLVIARVRLREDRDGTSLPGMIDKIRDEILRLSPAALTSFKERLMRAGYLELDAALYEGSRLLLHEICGFDVATGFPRLTISTVPAGDRRRQLLDRRAVGFRLQARSS